MGATATIALQGASLFQSVNAAKGQATSARNEGAYAAGVATQNAGLADRQAADAVTRGALAESRARTGTRQLIGSQRADLAAQGLDVSSGTAADLQADSARLGELDAQTIRSNAFRESWGYKTEAANQRAAAANATIAGNNTADAYNAQASSTLLTGAAGLYGQYQKNPPQFGNVYGSRRGSMFGASRGIGG